MTRPVKFLLISLFVGSMIALVGVIVIAIMIMLMSANMLRMNSLWPTALPATRPDDLTISYHEDGGMEWRGQSITITPTGTTYNANVEAEECTLTYQPTNADLDQLYNTLRTQRIDRLSSYVSETYDRGGNSIRLDWDHGNRSVEAYDSDSTYIVDADSDRFYASVTAIQELNAIYLAQHPEVNCPQL